MKCKECGTVPADTTQPCASCGAFFYVTEEAYERPKFTAEEARNRATDAQRSASRSVEREPERSYRRETVTKDPVVEAIDRLGHAIRGLLYLVLIYFVGSIAIGFGIAIMSFGEGGVVFGGLIAFGSAITMLVLSINAMTTALRNSDSRRRS